jgi:hypothetical protein
MQVATDLCGVYQGRESIVDFKQTNKPKRDEWITDYKLQMAAYAMAHDYVYGTHIEQGVIFDVYAGLFLPAIYYQWTRF